jgi:probable HAF family extracellular repeat protein
MTAGFARRALSAAGLLLALFFVGPQCLWAQSATFRQLPALGGTDCWAQKVSADGSTIVGATNASGQYHAAVWTRDGSGTDLGTLGGNYSGAEDVSADGNVVVGSSRNSAGWSEAFVWTAQGGMVGLGTLGGNSSAANGVSADGSAVVGSSVNGQATAEAFVWTAATGMVGLGTLGSHSSAYAASADGSTIVGTSFNTSNYNEAFIWTQAYGMVGLGTLGGNFSRAIGVSPDGSVVIGSSTNAAGEVKAFLWTAASGMLPLESLPGLGSSYAWTITADGSLAAGSSAQKGALWDTATGQVRDVQEALFVDYGIDTTGWKIDYCSVSADGYAIVGGGVDPQGNYSAWMVAIDKPPEELLEDLIATVDEVNTTNGIDNNLDSKLDSAVDAFLAENADEREDVINKLLSFIKAVEAQRGKKISDAEADELIAAAEEIIGLIV